MLSIDDPRFAPYLREFERQSGITEAEVRAMRPADARTLLIGWASANRLAQLDRGLHLDAFPPAPTRPRYERRSLVVAVALMSLTALSAIIICSGIWRFFS